MCSLTTPPTNLSTLALLIFQHYMSQFFRTVKFVSLFLNQMGLTLQLGLLYLPLKQAQYEQREFTFRCES